MGVRQANNVRPTGTLANDKLAMSRSNRLTDAGRSLKGAPNPNAVAARGRTWRQTVGCQGPSNPKVTGVSVNVLGKFIPSLITISFRTPHALSSLPAEVLH